MSERVFDALLLDIGDVITAPVWDQFDELEQVTGRTIVGRGPGDPNDDLWLRHERGEIGFVDYWQQYAQRNGFADWRDLFRQLGTYLPHRFGDPDAYELMADARTAGYKVGVLTNDGVAINGFAKPDPEPYLRAADELDVAPARVIFLDDAQACVDGAERVGMTAVRVDPIDKRPAFARTRSLLGISSTMA